MLNMYINHVLGVYLRMEVILHPPLSSCSQDQLSVSVAHVHADLAVSIINNLTCSEEQKRILFQLLSDECHI